MTDDSEGGFCPHCSGSGEGQHEGTTCPACGGSGEERDEYDSDDFDIPDELEVDDGPF